MVQDCSFSLLQLSGHCFHIHLLCHISLILPQLLPSTWLLWIPSRPFHLHSPHGGLIPFSNSVFKVTHPKICDHWSGGWDPNQGFVPISIQAANLTLEGAQLHLTQAEFLFFEFTFDLQEPICFVSIKLQFVLRLLTSGTSFVLVSSGHRERI